MSLSAEQLSDMRADLGDQVVPYAFSDAELDRLYVRTGNDYAAALVLAVDQLIADAAKLYNYTAGYTKIERKDISDNLHKLRQLFVDRDAGSAVIVGTAVVPPKHKEEPFA